MTEETCSRWRYTFADDPKRVSTLIDFDRPVSACRVIDALCERYSLREDDMAQLPDPPFDVWPAEVGA